MKSVPWLTDQDIARIVALQLERAEATDAGDTSAALRASKEIDAIVGALDVGESEAA